MRAVWRLMGAGAIALALGACTDGATSVPQAGAPVPGASAPVAGYEAPRVTPEQAQARIQAGEDLVILDVRSVAQGSVHPALLHVTERAYARRCGDRPSR